MTKLVSNERASKILQFEWSFNRIHLDLGINFSKFWQIFWQKHWSVFGSHYLASTSTSDLVLWYFLVIMDKRLLIRALNYLNNILRQNYRGLKKVDKSVMSVTLYFPPLTQTAMPTSLKKCCLKQNLDSLNLKTHRNCSFSQHIKILVHLPSCPFICP